MRLFAVFLLSWVSSALHADTNATITETLLVPPVFTVGDAVEMRVTLVLPEGLELRPIQNLPAQTWVVLHDVKIRQDPPFQHVTIKFTSFAPGEKVLPALKLGDVTLDNLHIVTASVLSATADTPTGLDPPRDQLPLPQTEIFLLLFFLVIIVLPLLAWKFLRPVFAVARKLWRHLERHRPYHRLVRESRKLQAKLSGLPGPEFYTQLLVLARHYLAARFHRDFSSFTAQEVEALLSPWSSESAQGWDRLFHKADVVRFDSREPGDAERLEDLEALRSEALALEEKTPSELGDRYGNL